MLTYKKKSLKSTDRVHRVKVTAGIYSYVSISWSDRPTLQLEHQTAIHKPFFCLRKFFGYLKLNKEWNKTITTGKVEYEDPYSHLSHIYILDMLCKNLKSLVLKKRKKIYIKKESIIHSGAYTLKLRDFSN